MKAVPFAEKLERGRLAESKIARWLRLRGWTVIPVYEVEMGAGKGPQVFTPTEELIAADLLVWKDRKFRFIEAKNKSVFTWHRKTKNWQTGIDLDYYEHYLRVSEHFGLDVWLIFLHDSAVPSASDLSYGCPALCPTGLFGESIHALKASGRKDYGWGRAGMIYWNQGALRLICRVEDLKSSNFCEVELFGEMPIVGNQLLLFPTVPDTDDTAS